MPTSSTSRLSERLWEYLRALLFPVKHLGLSFRATLVFSYFSYMKSAFIDVLVTPKAYYRPKCTLRHDVDAGIF